MIIFIALLISCSNKIVFIFNRYYKIFDGNHTQKFILKTIRPITDVFYIILCEFERRYDYSLFDCIPHGYTSKRERNFRDRTLVSNLESRTKIEYKVSLLNISIRIEPRLEIFE